MNRLGFKDSKEVATVYNEFVLNKLNNVLVEGIYTHFATTGFLDKEWDNQLDNFKKITEDIDLTKIPIVHLDRSITCVTHPNIEFANGARFGLAMYGYTVDKKTKPVTIKDKLLELKHKITKEKYNISEVDLENIPSLKPVLSLKTNIIQIKKIKKGEFVGYGAMYRAKEDEYIATLPIGYADGVDLRNLGRMVYINSNAYKIVGTVCMGMISVKVDERIKLGDVVEIIGKNINAQSIAQHTGQSTYSVITNISYELPRKYIERGGLFK
jgi:alanine racemase